MCATQLPASRQRGYSLLKVMLWLVILGAVSWQGMKFVSPYYVNWEIQSVFDGIVTHMEHADAAGVRARLPHLMSLNYIDERDLPAGFYDHLNIVNNGHGIEISSRYSKIIWMLGPVEAVDKHGDDHPDSLTGMDGWRNRARVVLHFAPHAGP